MWRLSSPTLLSRHCPFRCGGPFRHPRSCGSSVADYEAASDLFAQLVEIELTVTAFASLPIQLWSDWRGDRVPASGSRSSRELQGPTRPLHRHRFHVIARSKPGRFAGDRLGSELSTFSLVSSAVRETSECHGRCRGWRGLAGGCDAWCGEPAGCSVRGSGTRQGVLGSSRNQELSNGVFVVFLMWGGQNMSSR